MGRKTISFSATEEMYLFAQKRAKTYKCNLTDYMGALIAIDMAKELPIEKGSILCGAMKQAGWEAAKSLVPTLFAQTKEQPKAEFKPEKTQIRAQEIPKTKLKEKEDAPQSTSDTSKEQTETTVDLL